MHADGAMASNAPAQAAKQATNLSVNAALLRQARALGVNLSATFERALADAVRQRQADNWRAENAAAIAAYNTQVERTGLYADTARTF